MFLVCVVLLTSCDKKENATAKYPRVYITGQNAIGNKSATIGDVHSIDYVLSYDSLSVECYWFKEGQAIYGTSGMWFTEIDGVNSVGTIDRENNRLVIGSRYLEPDKRGYLDIFRSLGCAYIRQPNLFSDTLAWIPAESFRKFATALDRYDEEGLTPEVQQLFETALVFYPCTGEEYRATDDYAELQELIRDWNINHIHGR